MGRDDRELIVVESPGGAMKWMLVGAAVGAGLALLFAPRTGREMRQEIGRGVRGLKDMAEEAIDDLRGAAEEVLDEPAETESAPAEERAAGKVTAREELERRLAAARARRRATSPQEDEEPVA